MKRSLVLILTFLSLLSLPTIAGEEAPSSLPSDPTPLDVERYMYEKIREREEIEEKERAEREKREKKERKEKREKKKKEKEARDKISSSEQRPL